MQAYTVLVQASLIRHSLSFAGASAASQLHPFSHLLSAAGLCALHCNGSLCCLSCIALSTAFCTALRRTGVHWSFGSCMFSCLLFGSVSWVQHHTALWAPIRDVCVRTTPQTSPLHVERGKTALHKTRGWWQSCALSIRPSTQLLRSPAFVVPVHWAVTPPLFTKFPHQLL